MKAHGDAVTGTARNLALGLVGREAELAAIADFVAQIPRGRTLVLRGSPGIGKTTLWEAGIETARARGVRVLAARPSDAAARCALGSLIDLFDGVSTEELDGLPAPQLAALEVALLRAPAGERPEDHAIAVGVLNALRTLASASDVLVAVDDVQWLDSESESALAYAARRIEETHIDFLLAKRPGTPSSLEIALDRAGLELLDVGPLSLGGIRRLMHDRLGLSLPRRLLRRIFDTTLGNPLFALEVGRSVAEREAAIADDVPVPDEIEELVGTRVSRLPEPVRGLLLAIALSEDLEVGELADLGELEALEAAMDAGVAVVDGIHVRASHPLVAAAAARAARPTDRRKLHRRLASVVAEPELRVRHLALAAVRPDVGLAAEVASAAAEAARRGAAQAAVDLARHALRLTPRADPERTERALELGAYLEVAGDLEALTELLVPLLPTLPPGEPRVRAHTMLSSTSVLNDEVRGHIEHALAESGDDPRRRAPVLADLAMNTCLARVERIDGAERSMEDALPAAREAGPSAERLVLLALSWARALRGRPVDDLCERARAVSDVAIHLSISPERAATQRLAWRGEIAAARAALHALLAVAEERGEGTSHALLRLHLCELELRAGGFATAARLLDEWAESGEQELMDWAVHERCRALLAAGRGLPADARALGEQTRARAEACGVRWDELEAHRALGVAALLEHRPETAADCFRSVWEHTERESVEDPGVFPVAPDLVEALAELGEMGEAAHVIDRLGKLAERLDHPWGRASAARCTAVVSLAQAHDADAAADLERTAREYERLDLVLDAARSRLSLGRAQRRARKWASARSALQRAEAAFEELGSVGWAEEARSELARVGGRRRQGDGALTPAEQRVAELAAEGLANKEIARRLFVTVRTVEFHLKHVYAKLGVRSRTQLARRFSGRP